MLAKNNQAGRGKNLSANIEQVVDKILQAANFSNPPIVAEQLAEFHFDLDFDCRPLADTKILAELSVAQKKIYNAALHASWIKIQILQSNYSLVLN